jgi:hypothetical protein
MAKRKAPQANDGESGESVAGYFREIFKQNPKLLKVKSNEEVLNRWLTDHPGHSAVPKNVKGSLSNIKSVLRSKKRRKAAKQAGGTPATGLDQKSMGTVPSGPSDLEKLEHQIDECMMAASLLDRKSLASVIHHLRLARNEVVWKLG